MSTIPNSNAITGPADVLEFQQNGGLQLRGGGFDDGPDDEPWNDNDDDGYRVDDDDDGDDEPPGSPRVDY